MGAVTMPGGSWSRFVRVHNPDLDMTADNLRFENIDDLTVEKALTVSVFFWRPLPDANNSVTNRKPTRKAYLLA
jgi:hypothetical protein